MRRGNERDIVNNKYDYMYMKQYYDYVIVGAGISGLYTAYHILKKNKKASLVVLESSRMIGGRVHTFHGDLMDVEVGAGRIANEHTHVSELLMELGLYSKRVDMSHSPPLYIPSNGGRKTKHKTAAILNRLFREAEENDMNHPDGIHSLRNMTILEYAKRVISDEDIQYLVDSYGYYSELVLMNAYDCIQTLKIVSSSSGFYGLKGGFSQIIDILIRKVRMMGGVIYLRHSVKSIHYLSDGPSPTFSIDYRVHGSEQMQTLRCGTCICAVCIPGLRGLRLWDTIPLPNKLESNLQKIHPAPLCRIYSVFEKGVDGKVWFAGMGKMTTNNELRMIIPIDEERGVIMISYTDNKFADYWRDIQHSGGIAAVNAELTRLIHDILGITIPMPVQTKVFYWGCGVGYWGIGGNSYRVSREITQPFGSKIPLYVCGESYSDRAQQWIEGSLDTSERVLSKILSH
jgi:hypothetical protein